MCVCVCVSPFVHFPCGILVCQAGGQTASSNILLFGIDSMSANCHHVHILAFVCLSVDVSVRAFGAKCPDKH